MKKINLYNLSRMKSPYTEARTFFQQKWTAKAVSRAYHGEQITEKHWQRLFVRSRGADAVVPMNPEQLAENDGAEQAAGRGSGLQLADPTVRRGTPSRRTVLKPPYMQMVYPATERRLDTAVFRALFASSTRQARMFVLHGHVKVNGTLV